MSPVYTTPPEGEKSERGLLYQFVCKTPLGRSLLCPHGDFGSTTFETIEGVGVKIQCLTDFEDLFMRCVRNFGFQS